MNVNGQRLRVLLLALVSSLALSAPSGAGAATHEGSDPAALAEQIRKHRAATWHFQRVMGRPRTPTGFHERRASSLVYLTSLRDLWRRRAANARLRFLRPPHRAAWLCIHRHEGRWDDPDPTYYGGLQMDVSFQRAYGSYLLRRKGTADRWTPLEQMWTAEKALRAGRGFHPWPVAARRCGLI